MHYLVDFPVVGCPDRHRGIHLSQVFHRLGDRGSVSSLRHEHTQSGRVDFL